MGTFTRFLHDPHNSNSLINNKVKAIFEDSRGIFWIGTCGDGLHTMDREKGIFQRHTYSAERPEQLSRPPLTYDGIYDPISFIIEDSSGSIWIGTYRSGINRYDTGTKKITRYESNKGYPDKGCWKAYTSRDGVLWLASTEDNPFLYRVDPSIKMVNNVLTGAMANCIFQDDQGIVWVGVSGKGLFQYDPVKKLVTQTSLIYLTLFIFYTMI